MRFFSHLATEFKFHFVDWFPVDHWYNKNDWQWLRLIGKTRSN